MPRRSNRVVGGDFIRYNNVSMQDSQVTVVVVVFFVIVVFFVVFAFAAVVVGVVVFSLSAWRWFSDALW